MIRAKDLRQKAEDVTRFRDAFTELLEQLEKAPASLTGHFYRWVPKRGRDAVATEARERVARLAGPAGMAAQESGQVLRLQAPINVGGQVRIVNPVDSWGSALDPPNLLTVEDVREFCESLIGRFEAQADRAERDERSLAGRVARFVRFPQEVRRIAGSGGRAAGAAAFGLGVIVQAVVIGVAVTVISALILALLRVAR